MLSTYERFATTHVVAKILAVAAAAPAAAPGTFWQYLTGPKTYWLAEPTGTYVECI